MSIDTYIVPCKRNIVLVDIFPLNLPQQIIELFLIILMFLLFLTIPQTATFLLTFETIELCLTTDMLYAQHMKFLEISGCLFFFSTQNLLCSP